MTDARQLPVTLDGSQVRALIVGGGAVATRKARWLIDGGAHVVVRALAVSPALRELAESEDRLTIHEGEYESRDLDAATLVVAATSDRATNARVAEEARATRLIVLVADAPAEGNCVAPAVHRAGDLVVAVSTGGVPGAAARIRDAIASVLGERYAVAIRELSAIRRRLVRDGDAGRWRRAADALIGDDFCESIERGTLEQRMVEWR